MVKQHCNFDLDWSSLTIDAPKEDDAGFFADGWGGQIILVIPKENIVEIRTCGDGFGDSGTVDSSKYEMGDFLPAGPGPV